MLTAEYPCCENGVGGHEELLTALREEYQLWGPVFGADGICRLEALQDGGVDKACLPFLPVKKLLLPPGEVLWNYASESWHPPEAPKKIAVVGVPLCELQAVWYLDQVFAGDDVYLGRRSNLLLLGSECESSSACRCRPELMPIAGDLFLASKRLWVLSSKGENLVGRTSLAKIPSVRRLLPWPESNHQDNPVHLSVTSTAWQNAIVWEAEAKRCLSCGACSAVCPTCYCFDLLDTVDSRGRVSRQRVWDNCFFAEHGQVAGGLDFRSGRARRLKFRMEHKRLGFGDLRGQDSCVGCGRCRAACPVDIDLDEIARRLAAEEGG